MGAHPLDPSPALPLSGYFIGKFAVHGGLSAGWPFAMVRVCALMLNEFSMK